MRARAIGLAVAVAALCVVAGCGAGPVRVPAPQPPERVARACAALQQRLPERVDGLPRRSTSSPSALVAAWGSPPVVLRCGVARPERLRPTSQLAVVNGVAWFPEPGRSPMRYTAVDRQARVELLLPAEHGVPAGTLVDVAGPIKDALRPRDP